jgi:putative membrane protein
MTMNILLWPSVLATHHDWEGGPWLVWPLLWLAVIATVVWLVSRRRWERPRSGGERARDILAERFARGEIAGDEYRERLEQLR